VRALASSRAAVERLWDVCQVPDYRKIAPAMHAELAVTLYGFLMRDGKIPIDWFSRQVAQNDITEGGIDALSNRIAHVRTWTFGPIGRIGWPIPNIGRRSRVPSKTSSPMLCTSA
jgi:ATP-dependent RNA helicase SUPV3L1/SUV3